MKPSPTLEICTGSIQSVLAARQGGAHRVELCSALGEGGVTPSAGLLSAACRVEGIRKHVLIRPRGGDFLYTPTEVDIMLADIRAARQAGADGVVIGALTPQGHVDSAVCQRLIAEAQGMSITFHRAFDMVANMQQALEDVITLGCDRILTSGLHPSAFLGLENLRLLVEQARGRISIMPGAGVTPENAREILSYTHATEIHASARHTIASPMLYRNPTVTMGAADADEYARKETDPLTVSQILSAIHSI